MKTSRVTYTKDGRKIQTPFSVCPPSWSRPWAVIVEIEKAERVLEFYKTKKRAEEEVAILNERGGNVARCFKAERPWSPCVVCGAPSKGLLGHDEGCSVVSEHEAKNGRGFNRVQ